MLQTPGVEEVSYTRYRAIGAYFSTHVEFLLSVWGLGLHMRFADCSVSVDTRNDLVTMKTFSPWYLALLAALLLLIRMLRIGRRPQRYPPGPPTIPVLGNLHQVRAYDVKSGICFSFL